MNPRAFFHIFDFIFFPLHASLLSEGTGTVLCWVTSRQAERWRFPFSYLLDTALPEAIPEGLAGYPGKSIKKSHFTPLPGLSFQMRKVTRPSPFNQQDKITANSAKSERSHCSDRKLWSQQHCCGHQQQGSSSAWNITSSRSIWHALANPGRVLCVLCCTGEGAPQASPYLLIPLQHEPFWPWLGNGQQCCWILPGCSLKAGLGSQGTAMVVENIPQTSGRLSDSHTFYTDLPSSWSPPIHASFFYSSNRNRTTHLISGKADKFQYQAIRQQTSEGTLMSWEPRTTRNLCPACTGPVQCKYSKCHTERSIHLPVMLPKALLSISCFPPVDFYLYIHTLLVN